MDNVNGYGKSAELKCSSGSQIVFNPVIARLTCFEGQQSLKLRSGGRRWKTTF